MPPAFLVGSLKSGQNGDSTRCLTIQTVLMSETTSRSNGARREHVQTYCMDGVGQWSCSLFAVSVRPRKHTQVCNALWNLMTLTGNEAEIDLVSALRTPRDALGNFGHFPITCGTSHGLFLFPHCMHFKVLKALKMKTFW